jgi:hypothetical protein
MFDPYRKWLGIPEDQRPPTHYQMLGITPDEQDIEVIEAAMLRQSSFVRNFQSGQYAEEAARVLNEIAAARLCLVDPRKRAKYDAELRRSAAQYDAELRKSAPAKPVSPSPARTSESANPPTPTLPSTPVRANIDLDQLMAPMPRRGTVPGGRTALGGRALGRRQPSSSSVGYIWQVPLLAVILIVLIFLARTIGRTIAEQRAQHARPAPVERTPPDEQAKEGIR